MKVPRADVALRAAIAASTAAVLLVAPAAALARQSTLSLELRGAAVQNRIATLVASGTNADPESGSYYLFVYAKDERVDPTCAPTYEQESQTFRNNVFNPSTSHAFDALAIGQLESYGPGSFSIEIKKAFATPGRKLICAYSTFIAETAATTQMVVNVARPGSDTASAAKPANRAKPRVSRKGHRLSCSRGRWSNASTYRYSWVVNGKTRKGARSRSLSVTRSLRGRAVRCRVTAYNNVGKKRATSPSYRVR